MSKNIAISDDVYRRLKREKGDRSFSELIEERLDSGGELADVTGQRIFDAGAFDAVKEDGGELTDGTMARLDDEAR